MISGLIRDYAVAFGEFAGTPLASLDKPFTGISIDSRAIVTGNVFVAIKGDTNDGHDFVPDAIKRGAAGIIVSKRNLTRYSELADIPVVAVEDTLEALQKIAQLYLNRIAPKRIAITGTNGKTTTKALTAYLLSKKYSTCSTKGNLNNQFGVPLSIFEFDADCKVAVFEFGMSTPGEIQRLVELYSPDIRVILNIGPAHLESMKTIDAIAESKFEMLYNAGTSDWAVLNMDDPNIRSRSYRYKLNKLTFGTAPDYDVHPDAINMNGAGRAHLIYQGEDITIPILGMHQVSNCLAAISVARLMEIPFNQVKSGIESFVPTGSRMTSEIYQGVTIINDSYNSNPTSARGALDTIASMKIAGHKALVFGDMLELGDKAPEYHADLGKAIAASKIDLLVILGGFAKIVRDAALKNGMNESQTFIAADHSEAVHILSTYLKSGDIVLLKASRGMKLENVEIGLKATLARTN